MADDFVRNQEALECKFICAQKAVERPQHMF